MSEDAFYSGPPRVSSTRRQILLITSFILSRAKSITDKVIGKGGDRDESEPRGPRCDDFSRTYCDLSSSYLCVYYRPCSYFSRTYCDLSSSYRCEYYNEMDNAEWKSNMQEGSSPKNKKKCVAGQFDAVKYRSETYYWSQKQNREDYRGRQVLVLLTVVKE